MKRILWGDPRAATTIHKRTVTEVMESGLFVGLGLFAGVWHPFFFFFKCQTKGEWSTDWPLEDLGWNFGGCREGKGGWKAVQQGRLPAEAAASPSLEGFKAQPARPWLI